MQVTVSDSMSHDAVMIHPWIESAVLCMFHRSGVAGMKGW